MDEVASPGLLNGSDTPVIRADFELSSLSSSPVGDYTHVNTSNIIFIFDLIGTLIGANGEPIESAMQCIATLRQICRATRKTPIFFTYSEYVSDKERLSKARAIEQYLGFNFNSHSRILKELPQRKEYETIAEIYNNTFHTDLERVRYPVFFFDDSLDQVKSMHSSARRAVEHTPQMYFRSFHILEDASWGEASNEIIPLIRQRETSIHSTPNLSKVPVVQSFMKVTRPSGGKTSRKNKLNAKKSRKHLQR
jgi:hypothetical protein